MEKISDALISVEDAVSRVLEGITPLDSEQISISEAFGRVLADEVVSRTTQPPLAVSAMDGYAVRYADVADASEQQPGTVDIIEDIPAGYVGKKSVGAMQASRIMTGAPMPMGADTVVRVEDTRVPDGSAGAGAPGAKIQILDVEELGENVRRRGEDMKAGELLMPAGTEIGPGEVAALASAQRSFLSVHRRPTVTILSTGDELVEVDEPLEPGKIVNSNTTALAAMASTHGAVPVMLPTARDDEDEIRRAVEAALSGDLILSTGGVSVGEYDHIRKVLDDMGAEPVLWRVAMKPGKPLFFCVLRGKPYFGLPGNPVSGLMSFLQFVRPAVRKASGYGDGELLLPTAVARMRHEVNNAGDRREYQRARLDWEDDQLMADTAYRAQGSHILTSMLGANGVVVLEPGQQADAGDEVGVQIIGDVFGAG